MDKRNFFLSQNVQPEEMNGMLAAIDKAIGQAGFEAGGRGVVTGLSVSVTSPESMAVSVDSGMALFYDTDDANPFPGNLSSARVHACRLASRASVSVAADSLGAGTSVTAGQERWVTIAIRPKMVDSDPRTAIDGSTVNFVSTEAGELYVVAGSAATAGTASKPVVSHTGIRLADVLITFGMTSVSGAAINLGAREDLVHSLMGGDGGLHNASGYSLFWQSSRNAYGVGTLRAYVNSSGGGAVHGGLILTLNASWDPVTSKWYGVSGTTSFALRFSSNGMMFTMREESPTAGWGDGSDGSWGDATTPGNTDSVLFSPSGLKIFGQGKSARLKSDGVVTADGGVSGDDSSVTVIGGVVGAAGTVPLAGGVFPPMGAFIPFPRPFVYTPTRVTVHADASIYAVSGVGIGSTFDANVEAYLIVPTPYGIYIQVSPTALGIYTSWRRVITVSQ